MLKISVTGLPHLKALETKGLNDAIATAVASIKSKYILWGLDGVDYSFPVEMSRLGLGEKVRVDIHYMGEDIPSELPDDLCSIIGAAVYDVLRTTSCVRCVLEWSDSAGYHHTSWEAERETSLQ